MKVAFGLLVTVVFLIGCVNKPIQGPIIHYKNIHDHDEYVYIIVGADSISSDSLVKEMILPCDNVESLRAHKALSGCEPDLFQPQRKNARRDRYFRKLDKKIKTHRIIAFEIDSMLQNYSVCFDTTVVNSKDSVYYFHSR